jgi:hypothetical protein
MSPCYELVCTKKGAESDGQASSLQEVLDLSHGQGPRDIHAFRRSIHQISYLGILRPQIYCANRHAFNGNACIRRTAGLIYTQNVITPTTIHSTLTM